MRRELPVTAALFFTIAFIKSQPGPRLVDKINQADMKIQALKIKKP